MREEPRDWLVGKPAPALSLPATDGRSVSLSGLRGQPVLVTFLSHAA